VVTGRVGTLDPVPYAAADDGTRIWYDLSGKRSGDAVVMIQGLGADSRGWAFQRRAIGRSHRVITVDNRGVGRSDRVRTFDLEVMAADVLAVLDHAGVDAAHVIGASMGGVIAQIMAARHPRRVRSMVLCCTAARHHEWRRELLEDWAEVASQQGMRALLGRAMRWLIGPRSHRRFAAPIGLLGHLILSCPAESFVGQIEAILAMDDAVADEARGVTIPVLIVVGSQDILTPAGDSEELAEIYTNSDLVLINGAAHGFMVQHARELNRLIADHLEAHADARPRHLRPASAA